MLARHPRILAGIDEGNIIDQPRESRKRVIPGTEPVVLPAVQGGPVFPPGIRVKTWDIIRQRFYAVPEKVDFARNYRLKNGYYNIAEFVRFGVKKYNANGSKFRPLVLYFFTPNLTNSATL